MWWESLSLAIVSTPALKNLERGIDLVLTGGGRFPTEGGTSANASLKLTPISLYNYFPFVNNRILGPA